MLVTSLPPLGQGETEAIFQALNANYIMKKNRIRIFLFSLSLEG